MHSYYAVDNQMAYAIADSGRITNYYSASDPKELNFLCSCELAVEEMITEYLVTLEANHPEETGSSLIS